MPARSHLGFGGPTAGPPPEGPSGHLGHAAGYPAALRHPARTPRRLHGRSALTASYARHFAALKQK
eukprot:3051979-Heterocapsa_arctica.AAC.1